MEFKATVYVFHVKNQRKLPQNDLYTVTKVNLILVTEYHQKAAQNNPIRTIYIVAKIDNWQQSSKWMLCGDRNETIIFIEREFSKLLR